MRLTILIIGLILSATTVLGGESQSDSLDSVNKGTVVFHIEGFDSIKGKAMCAMFTQKKWLGRGYGDTARIVSRKATCEFKDIPYGIYGIAAFHDKDNNDKFNTFFGVPTESGCFSNNAPAIFGPPSFKKARFKHEKPETVLFCKIG